MLRSHRFMDFTEKEFNEWVSSDEEEEKDEIDPAKDSKDPDSDRMGLRSNSMIFKPFKPGKMNSDFRKMPKSLHELKSGQSMF